MSQNLTLPNALFNKLAQGAAQRGMTMEALLSFLSELVIMPDRPTERDRERSRRIEQLLDKYRTGPLTEEDRATLDQLITTDYQEAVARADRLIAVKKSQQAQPPSRTSTARQARSSPRSSSRMRK
jgi:parvulin-like peptidyl-prolyl isomerase